MKKILHLLLLPIVLATSCKKDGLTKETQTGANTFSCKVNGKVFIPCEFFGNKPINVGYNINNSKVDLMAECILQDPMKYVSIELNNFHGVGEYTLSDSNNICKYEEVYSSNAYPGALTGNTYTSNLTRNGKVIITKDDRINFILSGTFEFTAANTHNISDNVTVSSGRFDVKF